MLGHRLQPPTARAGVITRSGLIARLLGSDSPVITLVAPPGYGKTTVLAQWAARDSRPFAWVSVDDRDNDPIVLLRHVALALHGIEPLPQNVLETLAAPGPSIWKSAIPRLGSALAAFDQPIDGATRTGQRQGEVTTEPPDHPHPRRAPS